jgi:histidine phosphotransfer protein HptB
LQDRLVTAPVDLAALREITGGDADIERELFETFLQSATECVAALKAGYPLGRKDEWRKQAHALKGASLNLGAARLGQLCGEAQDSYQGSPEEKLGMLAAIEAEFARVKAFLDQASRGRA